MAQQQQLDAPATKADLIELERRIAAMIETMHARLAEPPLSAHELESIAESEAEIARGEPGTPHQDVMREFGLDPDAVV